MFLSIFFLMGAFIAQAQPKAGFKSDVTSGCTPLVVKFTDLSTGKPASWYWDLGNGSTSTQQDPGVIYIKPGTYTVKLVVTNDDGSDSIVKERNINVYGLPDVSFASSIPGGCSPIDIKFTDNSKPTSGSITEWIWDFGDGQISKEASPIHTYAYSDTFNVTLSVINSFGCKQTLTKNDLVKVPADVKAGIKYSYFNVCQPPAQIDFSNSSVSYSDLKHTWIFGDGTTSTQDNPSHTYETGGTFNVKLISQTAAGCRDTAEQVISVGSVKADFSVADSICTSDVLSFQNTSIPEPIGVAWSFGDGKTSDEISTVHTFNTPGVYTVTMIADFGNCTSEITKKVTVSNKPKASFNTNSKTNSCALPLTIDFTNTSTGAATYKWLFGDGKTSSEMNAVHTYTAAGFFDVSLVAFNANGCSDTITYKDYIKTGPPVITELPGLPASGCAPHTVNFTSVVSSSEPIVSYLWDFGDGLTSTLSEPVHVYQNIGSYDVTLTVTSQGGCSSSYTLSKAVELGQAPKTAFSARPLSTCASEAVSFFDESKGDVTEWLWMFGDGGTSTLRNPSHMYKDTGFFNITLIAKNRNCPDTLVIENYVQIFPPIAKFTTTLDCKKPYVRKFTDKSIGAKTYSWDFGDGQTASIPSPTHTYDRPGRYGISLTVSNGVCSYITYDSVFIVDESPSFTYAPMGNAVCKNDSVAFKAINYHTDAIATLLWKFGDGTSQQVASIVTDTYHKYDTAGNFNPVLITTDINGCKDTVDQKFKLSVYGPNAAFTNVSGTCVNSNVVFNDKSSSDGIHPIKSWFWSFGDGGTSTQNGSVDHLYSKSATYTVSLTLVDEYGCRDSVVKSKAVAITAPVARFTESDTLGCSKNVINFKSNSSGIGLKYVWNFGDGQPSENKNQLSHTYANAGIYSVSLIIQDRYGCQDTMTKPNRITISNPVASFILNDTIGMCPPLLVEPKNTSKNYISLNWDFADGTNTNIVNPQHYYSQPATYDLRLIVKGYGQCYDTATKKIVLKGPSGTLNYSKLKGCNPTEIDFSSTAKNVAEFVWDFNNGVVKHTKDTAVAYTYKEYGSYLPKLVLVDSAGCKVSVENKDRIVISDITAGIKQLKEQNKLFCDSSMFVFNDSSKAYYDEIKSYKWNFGDKQSNSTKNPTHSYNKAGVYNVTLTVISKIGCADSIAIPVSVAINKSPKVAVDVMDSVCQTSTVKFFASNTSNESQATTWKWSFGDGSVDAKQNAVYSYPSGGTYTATLTGTAANGCTDIKKIPVTVYATPKVSVNADSVLCYGNAVTLKATGASKYVWNAHPSLTCLDCATVKAMPETSTWFYATGSSANGCKASDSVYVRVQKPFKVTATSAGAICLGQSITLKASGSDQYEWSPKQYLDNPNSAQVVFNPTAATDITYKVIGRDNSNCFSDTSVIRMKVHPMPKIEIPEKNIVANAGTPFQIKTINSSDITRWKWSPADGLDNPRSASPTATLTKNATYTVEATNEGNCTVSEEVTVSVLCDGTNIFIPNTFSPNNDGMNDVFFPRGKGVSHIKSLRIFNRWGQMVFERTNVNTNTPSDGWDGTYKGKKQPLDVYVYMMEVQCDNGNINRINGNVTLLQ